MSAVTRVALVALAACGNDGAASPPGPHDIASFPAVANPDLDILFLVDNSAATADYQNNFGEAAPAMFAVLDTLDTPANLHIGVATSDLGTTGSLDPDHPAPGVGSGPGMCAGHGDDGALISFPPNPTFLIDIANPDGTRMQNFTGAITDVLSVALKVGSSGCGFEQHLASIRRALTNPANAGFIRPTANLGIVLLADEDDCSVRDAELFSTTDTTMLGPLQSFRCTQFGVRCDQDLTSPGPKTNCAPLDDSPYIEGIDSFAAFFTSFKADPRMLAFTEVVGDPTPFAIELRPPPGSQTPIAGLAHSCNYTDSEGGLEVADPAVRNAALLDALPESAVARSSVCTRDLSSAATAIGHALKKTIGDPCVDFVPGCSVYEDELEIPMCPADGDCYELRSDAHACPDTPGSTRVDIQGAPPAGTYIHVRC
jgi:hypothetical protein